MKPDEFRDVVLDQLRGIAGVESRAMFGGHGLYAAGKFFGLIWRGQAFLKTNESSRHRYLAAGMRCFQPRPGQSLGAYCEVPVEVVENAAEFTQWARLAIELPGGEPDRNGLGG